jgi:hypothetical protein
MQYLNYDNEPRADEAPWTAAPNPPRADAFDSQLMPLTPNPLTPAQSNNHADSLALGTVLQALQQTQIQQLYLVRGMETRLARLEELAQNARGAQSQTATDSFERATWWALWGLLMLVLGGALAAVTMLILLNVQW